MNSSGRDGDLRDVLRRHQLRRQIKDLLSEVRGVELVEMGVRNDVADGADSRLVECFRGGVEPTWVFRGERSEVEVVKHLQQRLDEVLPGSGDVLMKFGGMGGAGWLRVRVSGADWFRDLWSRLVAKELFVVEESGGWLIAVTEEEIGYYMYFFSA